MNQEHLNKILEELELEENIELNDIPNIDLYMDQLITLFEGKLQHTKRYEEDKLLTKTMINNYIKDKLLMPAVKKKYTKQHIILMILIYEMKQIISITDIKKILSHSGVSSLENKQLEGLYQSYLNCKEVEKRYFEKGLEKRDEIINIEIQKLGLEDTKDIEIILLIESLITQASYHKRVAERLIDYMVERAK